MDWPNIIDAAHEIGLTRSASSPPIFREAFNRPELWDEQRTEEVKLDVGQSAPSLKTIIESLITRHAAPICQPLHRRIAG